MDAHPKRMKIWRHGLNELGEQPQQLANLWTNTRIVCCSELTRFLVQGYPQQVFCEELYEIYYRFLETEDEYFASRHPWTYTPQGRWYISGIRSPGAHSEEDVLRQRPKPMKLP